MGMDLSFVQISARFMFLFPIIGALIGIIAGLYSFFTYNFLLLIFSFLNNTFFLSWQNTFFLNLPKALSSIMTLAFLFLLTGLQHIDGLIDVGNALSVRKASAKERAMVAHAWNVTQTGALMAISVSLCSLLPIFLISSEVVIQSLVVAEVAAKLAMVTCAWQGSSPQKGLGSLFIDSMRKRHSLYLISLLFSLAISVFLLGLKGLLAVALGIILGGLMIALSMRVFEGVTGDILGATNEIARMITLLALM